MKDKLLKYYLPIIAVLVVLIGFFVPFGIMEGNKGKTKDVPAPKQTDDFSNFAKITNKSNWTLSNSYSIDPYKSKETIIQNVGKVLKLNDEFSIKICKFGSDITVGTNFDAADSLPVDPYNPRMLFKFDLIIGHKGKVVFSTNIDNSWIVSSVLKGLEIGYLDLFTISSNSNYDVGGDIANNLENFYESNKTVIDNNVKENKLGDDNDTKMFFSSIAGNDFVINRDTKKFYLESQTTADFLNEIVSFPPQLNLQDNKFNYGKENQYAYFSNIDISSNYFHGVFNLGKYDTEYYFQDSYSKVVPDTSIEIILNDLNAFLSSIVLNNTNLTSDYLRNPNNHIFDLHMMKSASGTSEYTNDLKVSDMWGFSKGDAYCWVKVDGLNKNYAWLSPLISFDKNYSERFETGIIYQEGNK